MSPEFELVKMSKCPGLNILGKQIVLCKYTYPLHKTCCFSIIFSCDFRAET